MKRKLVNEIPEILKPPIVTVNNYKYMLILRIRYSKKISIYQMFMLSFYFMW